MVVDVVRFSVPGSLDSPTLRQIERRPAPGGSFGLMVDVVRRAARSLLLCPVRWEVLPFAHNRGARVDSHHFAVPSKVLGFQQLPGQ